MKVPRDISGRDVVRSLCRDWKYRKIHQEGSHIILQTEVPSHHRISVPDHNTIRIGTLINILGLIAIHKGVQREDILKSVQGHD